MNRQLTLGVRLRDGSIFASYYPGRNQRIVEVLRAGLTGNGPLGPLCVWLFGPRGVGKTHLLQAVCAAAGERDAAAAYLPLASLASGDAARLSGFGELSVVCLDDTDAIAGNGPWERALFNLYRELEERGGRLVVASDAAPSAVAFGLPDLASRLNASLVLTLQTLDDDEQVRALQLRAHLRGFELPDEAAQYLLRRLPRDMVSLCTFLDELDEESLVSQRRLTVPFVREVMDRRAL